MGGVCLGFWSYRCGCFGRTILVMGRPKLGPHARTIPLTIKVSQADLALLDAQRGGVTRSAYIRSLIARDRDITKPRDITRTHESDITHE